MAHCRLHRATLFRDGIKRFDELARWVRPSHSLGSHTTVVRDQIKQFDHLAPARMHLLKFRNVCYTSEKKRGSPKSRRRDLHTWRGDLDRTGSPRREILQPWQIGWGETEFHVVVEIAGHPCRCPAVLDHLDHSCVDVCRLQWDLRRHIEGSWRVPGRNGDIQIGGKGRPRCSRHCAPM